MNNVNFTGGFRLKQPSMPLLKKFFSEVMPETNRIIVPNVPQKGDYFVVIKSCYDREVAEYLLKRPFNIAYYPNINLHSRLDPKNPKEAKAYISKETEVLKKAVEINQYVSKLEYSKKPIKYRWKLNDHIEQSVKALQIRPENYEITTVDHITQIRSKDGNNTLIALISPKNQEGYNYIFEYPQNKSDEIFKVHTINYRGEIVKTDTDIANKPHYNAEFKKAVAIDRGRKLPANIDV